MKEEKEEGVDEENVIEVSLSYTSFARLMSLAMFRRPVKGSANELIFEGSALEIRQLKANNFLPKVDAPQ